MTKYIEEILEDNVIIDGLNKLEWTFDVQESSIKTEYNEVAKEKSTRLKEQVESIFDEVILSLNSSIS